MVEQEKVFNVCFNATNSIQLSSQLNDKEELPESEGGRISTLSSVPDSQIVHSDGGASLVASGETQMDGRKHDLTTLFLRQIVIKVPTLLCVQQVASHSSSMIGILRSSLEDFGTKYSNGWPVCRLSWRVISALDVLS
ncbi:squamosa promoter-binding-like protein 7 [Prunus yedoensis var. nudiflora]|uniref:Squamosa promoter-binding-like protein 7 n=1 Tax=Prunus yedoensis var. nudiflora TaxID=2094558 RepID=A0A314ZJ63_PRUYE|nr:squamosa promoter-binding-like protein 7 [Prunus yedoensis var. nudiflora]